MRSLMWALGLLLSTSAAAGPRVYKLDLDYQYIIHNADPVAYEIAHENWTTAWQMSAGVAAGRYFLEPRFHLESAYSKVMTAGLYFKHGFRITRWLDFVHTHHSRHLLDRKPLNYSEKRYPLWDAIELNVHFIPGGSR